MRFIKKIFIQFIYKEKYETAKKHNQKFKKHMKSALFWSFGISIVLLLWRSSTKYILPSKHWL